MSLSAATFAGIRLARVYDHAHGDLSTWWEAGMLVGLTEECMGPGFAPWELWDMAAVERLGRGDSYFGRLLETVAGCEWGVD